MLCDIPTPPGPSLQCEDPSPKSIPNLGEGNSMPVLEDQDSGHRFQTGHIRRWPLEVHLEQAATPHILQRHVFHLYR